jgi:hypothetical protein
MASTAKVWIISRYGWEYDDSRYYRPESEGSYPVSAFTIPELAKRICDEKNVTEVRAMGIRGLNEYVSSWEYNSEEEDHKEFLESHFLDSGLEFTKPPSEIDDQILVEIMDYFHLRFYEVVEVELLA